jgi:hypothetical protein
MATGMIGIQTRTLNNLNRSRAIEINEALAKSIIKKLKGESSN